MFGRDIFGFFMSLVAKMQAVLKQLLNKDFKGKIMGKSSF